MRILGIDPGFARVGWAILEREKGRENIIDYGCIETQKDQDDAIRLTEVFNQVNILIQKYKPSECAIEELYFAANAKTAMRVGQSRGVIILACYQHQLSVYSYSPLQVKSAITGYGNADKNQVQQMVKQLAGLKTVPKPDDAADAIAIAFTHSTARSVRTK